MDHKIEFELNDAAGVAHTYIAHLHPADIGLELSFELVSVLGEPLLKAMGDLKDVAKTTMGAGDDELEEAFDGLDIGAALASFRSLDPKALSSLSKRILSHTYRDGARLKEGLPFGKAYQGNYGEMYLALWKVIAGNRFIPLLGTSSETE